METSKYDFLLNRLSEVTGIPLAGVMGESVVSYSGTQGNEDSPVHQSAKLRALLLERAQKQTLPCLYCDQLGAYFLCVQTPHGFLMAGPMCSDAMDKDQIVAYGKLYGLARSFTPPEIMPFRRILEFARLLAYMTTEQVYETKDLLTANGIILDENAEMQELAVHQMQAELEEQYHHTFMDERKITECVAGGREEEAVRLSRQMDRSVGVLSKNKRNNLRNQAITEIAVCTRAAIEGGISPATAYRLSDYYIMKLDTARESAQIMLYRDQCVHQLAHEVHLKNEKAPVTNYVEQCKDYINKNFRNKIYIEDIAESIGISASYLSRLFRAETGKKLEEYIMEVRLEKAKKLLAYSDETLASIAAYVNFPSQSYFGEKFKKYVGVTPMQYRNKHKPSET